MSHALSADTIAAIEAALTILRRAYGGLAYHVAQKRLQEAIDDGDLWRVPIAGEIVRRLAVAVLR